MAVRLASLEESELRAVNEVFNQLSAPLNRSTLKATGKRVHERVNRLTDDEAEGIVGLLLQLLTTPSFMELLEDTDVIDEPGRARIEKSLEFFGSNQYLRKVVATDKLLERGPRLQQMSCSCDVRTEFANPLEGEHAGDAKPPREEIRLPIAIVRMKTDEIPQPIYFQLMASELEEHISTLQRARDQLRYLEDKEKERK